MWMFKRTFTCCPSNRLTTQILGLVPTLAHLACLRWKRRKVFPRSNVSVEKPTQRLLLSGKEWAFFCLLLWPLVISKQLGQFHFSASKWKTAWLQEVKRYTMHQTEDAFLGKYFFFCDIFSDPLQFLTTKKYNTEDETRTDPIIIGGFLCVICWTVWKVYNSMSFYLHRYWRMLFWPCLWPLLCQLCRKFPMSLS